MEEPTQQVKEILGIRNFLKTKKMSIQLGDGSVKECYYIDFADMKDFHWVQPNDSNGWLRVHENQITVIL